MTGCKEYIDSYWTSHSSFLFFKEKSEEDKLKASLKGNVKCRICKMDHWTKECPYKDDLGAIR